MYSKKTKIFQMKGEWHKLQQIQNSLIHYPIKACVNRYVFNFALKHER